MLDSSQPTRAPTAQTRKIIAAPVFGSKVTFMERHLVALSYRQLDNIKHKEKRSLIHGRIKYLNKDKIASARIIMTNRSIYGPPSGASMCRSDEDCDENLNY